MPNTQWETVIGLEVHAQLATKSKIFSRAATAFGAEPNTQACAVDLGLPGVLPVLNKTAVAMAIKFGLAADAKVNHMSEFSRKHYFYADLPKGYQITQFEHPVVGIGHLDITLSNGREKRIGITRAHLEEDAGKSLHEDFHGKSGIDLNRAGTPLLEIVSEPDMRSAEEAVAYLKTLHALVRCLEICDGNMQEGSFRCDVNISVRPMGTTELGTRTEMKNLNSFRFVERSIAYEVNRQIEIIESGGKIDQETRLYDVNKNETRALRSKENALDYRYFPDPDLLPLHIDQAWIDSVAKDMPELPQAKKQRFVNEYGLNNYDATQMVASRRISDYFETTVKASGHPKLTANWMLGELFSMLKQTDVSIENAPVTPELLAELIKKVSDKTLSSSAAKLVFAELWQGEGSVDEIIKAKGLAQISDTGFIATAIDEVIANNPDQLEQYRAGKDKLFAYFVGKVMQATKGKANPQEVSKLLREKLSGK